MKNDDFIEQIKKLGFSEEELIEVYYVYGDKTSEVERKFVLNDMVFFIHVDGTKEFYVEQDTIKQNGDTPKECIESALLFLQKASRQLKYKLNKLKNKL